MTSSANQTAGTGNQTASNSTGNQTAHTNTGNQPSANQAKVQDDVTKNNKKTKTNDNKKSKLNKNNKVHPEGEVNGIDKNTNNAPPTDFTRQDTLLLKNLG